MKINLKNAKHMQTLKGWGTSACWWSQYCRDEKTSDEIARLLYSKSGLGLNIYRYNIGGGTDEDNCRLSNPWRKTESMYVYDRETQHGEYDFSRDKTAVDMMKRCVELECVDTVILFANSPHYSQTSTGQSSGSLLYSTCNIPKSNYRKFADYFLNITQHFIDMGLPVKYISPVNEPQWKWGGTYVWQEGCHYETEELAEVFHIFAEEIIRRGMPVKLYGPESGEMLGKTEEYFKALTADETVMKVLDVFAYHSYHSDDKPEERYEFKKNLVSKHPELRFDMSEWCELPNKSHTKDFKGALITARIIGQDLIYAGSESWTSWVAVNQIFIKEDSNDYSDGLITASNNFDEWHIAERYWGFAHFSKYIPIGSECLDTGYYPDSDNNMNIFAFKTPEGETVIVCVNEKADTKIGIDGEYKNMKIIESSQEYKLKTVYEGKFKNSFASKLNTIQTVILK